MLEEEDIEECSNNNIVVHCISENNTLKEMNESLNKQVNVSIEMHEVEKMKVEEIETCLKLIEKDYKEALREEEE